MIDKEKINDAILALTKGGQLPLIFKQLDNLSTKDGKLYVGAKEVISKEDAPLLIAKFDHDARTTGGSLRIWNHICQRYYGISRPMVERYISNSAIHQTHQPSVAKYTVRSIIPSAPWKVIQIDLIDLSNEGQPMKWAMTAIDVFSKMTFAKPTPSKSTKDTAVALEAMLKEMNPNKPASVQTDRGKEWEGEFDQLLTKQGIEHTRSREYTPQSQGGVERYNQTLKRDLFRLLAQRQTNDWAPLLRPLVENHNSSITRSTGKRPDEISTLDQSQLAAVKSRMESQKVTPPTTDFHKGDTVRIALTANDRKGQEFRSQVKQNWSNETYTIHSISKPKSANTAPQFVLSRNKVKLPTKYWAYQLLRIDPETVNNATSKPLITKEEKLDRLDKVDEPYVPPARVEKQIAKRATEKKEPTKPPPVGQRRSERAAKKFIHGDYVYYGDYA